MEGESPRTVGKGSGSASGSGEEKSGAPYATPEEQTPMESPREEQNDDDAWVTVQRSVKAPTGVNINVNVIPADDDGDARLERQSVGTQSQAASEKTALSMKTGGFESMDESARTEVGYAHKTDSLVTAPSHGAPARPPAGSGMSALESAPSSDSAAQQNTAEAGQSEAQRGHASQSSAGSAQTEGSLTSNAKPGGKTIVAPGGMALRFAAGARTDASGVPGAPAPSSVLSAPAQAPNHGSTSSSSSALPRLDEPKMRTLTALTDISTRSFGKKESKIYSKLDMMNLR